MFRIFFYFITLLLIFSCNRAKLNTINACDYLKNEENGIKTAGIQLITLDDGKNKVWTKRIGNNPKIKVLLLHGGPGTTHEYWECMESFFPQEGIEFYYYDQLGSAYSDQPEDTSLWNLPRFVEELEQVRKALGLNQDNFYLLGHSWGGILAAQYALKYQDKMKGLIISNMMMSCPDYGKYADEVLSKQMDPDVLSEIKAIETKGDFANPRYMELLMPNFYSQHICRIPMESWPDPINRAFAKLNSSIYVMMQGPSEFGIKGKLINWDIKSELPKIKVPTLVIGATHDTMDPEHMKWVSTQVQKGRYLHCPNGSHMCMWDDQEHYFPGLISFLKDVDNIKM
ncbi:MAG: proline iminopeptidase-family hydrolase [Saprospiraceae bacterium]|nr:proline iminopeptidase-family hydrolase [Saprospiraceae bacterium]MBK9630049.1 proline iminopeptidase-family hydrolase [Saprospiraceae bacterium]